MNGEFDQLDRRLRRVRRALPAALVAGGVALGGLLGTRALAQDAGESDVENRRCLECHGQKHLGELIAADREMMVLPAPDGSAPESAGVRPGLFLGSDATRHGVHADLRCVDCHTGASSLPHSRRLPPPDCGACHVDAEADFDRSVHAESLARGRPDAPTCSTCHGGHGILPVRLRESLAHPLNAVRICGDCHEQHAAPTSNGVDAGAHVQAYLDSVHGRGVKAAGLAMAATCSSCHRAHEVRAADDPLSATQREQVPATCGRCHLGVVEVYAESIHGRLLLAGDEDAPVCTDCHAGHRITHASTPEHHLDIVAECGECHDRAADDENRRASFYATYRASYHGQVTALGSTRAARCSDCHGTHDIRSIEDPGSRMHVENRVETCGHCHEGATAGLTLFDPHADYRDRARYPLLYGVWMYFIIIMSMAFGFYGLHSVLWLVRSLIERVRHGPHPRFVANSRAVRRFTRISRVNHAILILTFFGLTLTGIPLLFSDQAWAKNLAWVIGGVYAAGLWHRAFAVMLLGNLVVHFLSLVRSARQRRGPLVRGWLVGPFSLLPRWKDVQDCVVMFRWFFGAGPKPSFGRWTYWEKFDYWAEIAGTLIIGGSGLLLWFPTFFGAFVPGWIFNVAMIVHGYEALLALGFIFTIHFFNAHLRLEKFPVDDVIFTGQLPLEEFILERREEHDLLVKSGTLAEHEVAAAPAWQRRLAVVVGVAAMVVGLTLVTLIILAGFEAL